MLRFKSINFTNIESEFYDSVTDESDIIEDFDIAYDISPSLLDDFNNRVINPDNINSIIKFFDFLMVKNTLQFIIENAVLTISPYLLNKENMAHYTLPSYMIKLSCDNAVKKYGQLKWLFSLLLR